MAEEITIYGAIGDAQNGETTKTINEKLKRISDDVDWLKVRINSEGGSVAQGVAIAGLLRDHPAKIHTIVEGGCFSIASYIASIGDKRTIHADAIFHTHGPQLSTSGNLSQHEDSVKELKIATDVMSKRFSEVTGQSTEKIVEGFSRDLFFDAHEAVEAGYMTDVADEAHVSASVDPNQFETLPRKYAAALAGQGGNTPTTKRGENMAVAKIKDLQEALPDADDRFLITQLTAEASIESATAAWESLKGPKAEIEKQAKKIKQLETANAQLKAELKAMQENDDNAEAEEDEQMTAKEMKIAALRAEIDELEAMDDDEVEAMEEDNAEAMDEDEDDEEVQAAANARAKAQRSRTSQANRNGNRTNARGLSTRGRSPGRKKTSTKDELSKRVEARMSANKSLTRPAATAQVFSEDPDFHDSFMEENSKEVDSRPRRRR